jgi:hypothetical protein
MTILLKVIHRFSTIPKKIPTSFFAEIEKSVLKFTWKHKGPQISKYPEQKEQCWKYQHIVENSMIYPQKAKNGTTI